MEPAPPILVARDLQFAYARRGGAAHRAVDGVSFEVAAGASVAILGPNGCGKSTLLQLLCGQLEPAAGTVDVTGAASRAKRAARLGVVFQSPALDPHMTIEENLRESAVLFDLPAATAAGRIEEALRGAGLAERRRALVKRLSGGLRRRVDLCRALLHEPAILLLDEPTTGLDPRARVAFFETLDAEQARRSLTIVMTTHVLDEAEHSDRVLLMHEGRLIADGAPGSLRSELGAHQITVTDGAWRPAAEDAARWSSTSAGLVCRAADDELPPLAADLARRGVAFRLAPPTLADVFEAHTGAALDGDASPPVLGEASP